MEDNIIAQKCLYFEGRKTGWPQIDQSFSVFKNLIIKIDRGQDHGYSLPWCLEFPVLRVWVQSRFGFLAVFQLNFQALIAARFVSYLLTIFSILLMFLFSISILCPLVGGLQFCRRMFIITTADTPRGAVALISISDIMAHVCLDVVKFRKSLSHISSIASLQAHMSRRFSPPSFRGLWSYSSVIVRCMSLSHIKSLMIFVIASSICIGMPCAFVRNSVCPPTTACIISLFL